MEIHSSSRKKIVRISTISQGRAPLLGSSDRVLINIFRSVGMYFWTGRGRKNILVKAFSYICKFLAILRKSVFESEHLKKCHFEVYGYFSLQHVIVFTVQNFYIQNIIPIKKLYNT